MKELKIGIAAAIVVSMALVTFSGMDLILVFLGELLTLFVLAGRLCLGGVMVAGSIFSLYMMRRQRQESLRQRDGAYALREYSLVPWTVRFVNALKGIPSPTVVYDPNSNLGHAAVIADKIYTVDPSAGWDRQLAYNQEIEKTRRVQAAVPGDNARLLPWGVREGSGGKVNAPTARLLAGAYDKPAKVQVVDAGHMLPAPVEIDVQPARVWTPESAVKLATRTKLPMGVQDNGELVWWDMKSTPHLRYHGATQGSGKTNALQTLAAAAVVTNAHLIIMDRRRFKDWGAFGNRAERVDTTDSRAFVQGLVRLHDVYKERDVLLGQHGAANISELPDVPKRIVCIISEFGAMTAQAQADGVLKDAMYALEQILRQAGATGIHMLFEDQVTDKWPKGIEGNAIPVIGKMPAYAGMACGYQGRGGGTDTFAPYTFWYEGAMFKSLHMAPALPGLLGRYPDAKERVIDGEYSVRSVRSVGVEGGIEAPGYPVRTNERQNERQNAPIWAEKEDIPTDLQAAVWEWRDAYPNGTQAELRRAFAESGIEITKSYVHTLWHRWQETKDEGGE